MDCKVKKKTTLYNHSQNLLTKAHSVSILRKIAKIIFYSLFTS